MVALPGASEAPRPGDWSPRRTPQGWFGAQGRVPLCPGPTLRWARLAVVSTGRRGETSGQIAPPWCPWWPAAGSQAGKAVGTLWITGCKEELAEGIHINVWRPEKAAVDAAIGSVADGPACGKATYTARATIPSSSPPHRTGTHARLRRLPPHGAQRSFPHRLVIAVIIAIATSCAGLPSPCAFPGFADYSAGLTDDRSSPR